MLFASASAHAAAAPRFEAATCDLPGTAAVGARLRCGVVRVPRDHAHPDGPTYALAVVVVASATQPARADPVVYISGGPGAPLTVYAGYQAAHPYALDRDLILVDQRGMGRSEPRLCPEMESDLVNGMLAVVTAPTTESLDGDRAVHAACHAAVLARGIDPNTFGTLTTVEDFEWVRRALDVERWNVVGESYGTTVAMTLVAHHPDSIRSVVLDSLNPPDAYVERPWSARVGRARDAFFAACAKNPNCASTTPDLAALYRQALARVARVSPTVPLLPTLRVPGNAIRLTPSLFEDVVGRMVYYPQFYADLPHLIAATRDGDWEPVGSAIATLLAGAESRGNEGAFTAVECRDGPRWREAAAAAASPLDLALLPPGTCSNWSALGPEPEVPRDAAVPTLVLQGEFDPNIGPEESRHVADLIGHQARWIEFAGIGHSVRHYSACAQEIVAAFIAAPDRRLQEACASQPWNGSRAPSP